jgi:hypothetical protein
MFPKPKPALRPNTYPYESEPLVKPTRTYRGCITTHSNSRTARLFS